MRELLIHKKAILNLIYNKGRINKIKGELVMFYYIYILCSNHITFLNETLKTILDFKIVFL